MKPTRQIRIQNPPSAPGVLRLEPERLELALAGRGLASSFAISQGEGDHLPDTASDARILFPLTKAPLDEARRVAPGLKWVQTAYAGVEKRGPFGSRVLVEQRSAKKRVNLILRLRHNPTTAFIAVRRNAKQKLVGNAHWS